MPTPRLSTRQKPLIALTMGDPAGIGPEVIVKALADLKLRNSAHFVIFGLESQLLAAAHAARIKPYWSTDDAPARNRNVMVVDDFGLSFPGKPPPAPNTTGGRLSLLFLESAIHMARGQTPTLGRADAIVTAPICKEAWALAGESRFPGHTELFAHHFRAKRHAMMFVSPNLRVILATIHEPLANVPKLLTKRRILDTIELGHQACQRLGIKSPRIAVCGLNPHAGENGLLGHEEQRTIAPAIAAAKRKRINATGPHPGDTVFNSALRGVYDLVVAMYHDQGLIPVKLLAWDTAVNWTLGLPIIRTSPDHGTAFTIAGNNKADAGSMDAAISLAVKLANLAPSP